MDGIYSYFQIKGARSGIETTSLSRMTEMWSADFVAGRVG